MDFRLKDASFTFIFVIYVVGKEVLPKLSKTVCVCLFFVFVICVYVGVHAFASHGHTRITDGSYVLAGTAITLKGAV